VRRVDGRLSVKRIGHKGADAIAPGNTLESFAAAVEIGVEMIELDVLRPRSDFADGRSWRREPAGPTEATGPFVIAHDWGDASRRDPLTLEQALAAFTEPPLDSVELDCDLKLAGREDELAAALREHDLLDRAMVSTMEIASLLELRRHEPRLRLGWTLPRLKRDPTRIPGARPFVAAAVATYRARLPAVVRRRGPRLGVQAIWAYHPLITRRLADAAHAAGLELYAWTVDDLPTMRAVAERGADGICSNDPRLFAELSSRADEAPARR
jgi:glycerophosphoryl diester phosphodiesterase